MVYVHVPYCRSFCTYCGFYSELCSKKDDFSGYSEAVLGEIAERGDEIAESCGTPTLYIGGGTPSVLPPAVVSEIAEAVRAHCPGGFREFTFEANPEDIVEKGGEYVRSLLDLGVNRISLGMQSFDDRILRWMNRRHSAAHAKEAYRIVREAERSSGKQVSVSVDLIFGLEILTDEVWDSTISQVLALGSGFGCAGPEHISCYQLSVEEGSALAEMAADGRFREAPEEQCRRQYDMLCSRLAGAGFRHYEISNFARPGYEAVHNSAYWSRVPYVGIGPGAHSYRVVQSDGKRAEIRSWNEETLPKWTSHSEILTPEDTHIERIMLPLRTEAGLEREELCSLSGSEPVERLLAEGALELNGTKIRIPEERMFTSDEIIKELI